MFTKQTAERFKLILNQQKQEIENLLRSLLYVYRSLDNPTDHKEFIEIKVEYEQKLQAILKDIAFLETIQSSDWEQTK